MQVKGPDDRRSDLDALAHLLERNDLRAGTRTAIEREIRMIRAGAKAERDAAYYIESAYGASRNVMTLHDVRLTVGDQAAQIDHLVVNRLLEVWICESKSFSDSVEVNERGEWSATYRGRVRGLQSPLEQAKRQARLVERLFQSGAVKLPKRLGITLHPTVKRLVLVSPSARIRRPAAAAHVPGIESVIKADQLETTISAAIDAAPARSLVKLLRRAEVESVARQLASLHTPLPGDWAARFGLAAMPGQGRSASSMASPRRPAPGEITCASCGRSVSARVAAYSRQHREAFGDRILCFECQHRLGATPA